MYDPMYFIDAYKIDHRRMYPEGTEFIYSNLTPRGSRIEGIDHVVSFGLQAFLQRVLMDMFDDWFEMTEEAVVAQYERRTNGVLGPNSVGTDHIRALHRLGYLPLEFRAIPEGMAVPLRVPLFTIENTLPEFFWLTNYVETILSAETWQPATSATIALHMRELLDGWADKTSSNPAFVDFQGHDFSFRGMSSLDTAAASGAGHLLSFAGTDTMIAMDWIESYYGPVTGWLGGSVAATEHSVMCAGGLETEEETFRRLLNLYPSGIVSVVSDTWDLWKVLTEYLPSLKDEIMARDGKLVIRPDSGDPTDILCGSLVAGHGGIVENVTYYTDSVASGNPKIHEDRRTPEEIGVIELLWKVFGGTVNEKGYKELDPHIGAIYGDSINYDRADEICRRLEAKGFASTNVVFGIGSYTYQYNTRDTFGFAMKATWAQINGVGTDLYKDPVTDSGLKRSAKGRLAVIVNDIGGLTLLEGVSKEIEESPDNQLKLVWKDGKFVKKYTWNEVVNTLAARVIT